MHVSPVSDTGKPDALDVLREALDCGRAGSAGRRTPLELVPTLRSDDPALGGPRPPTPAMRTPVRPQRNAIARNGVRPLA